MLRCNSWRILYFPVPPMLSVHPYNRSVSCVTQSYPTFSLSCGGCSTFCVIYTSKCIYKSQREGGDTLMMDEFSWWLVCENTALLRGNGMHLGHRLHMFRRCLWDCKVRGWYFGNGCSKTWFDRQEYIGPLESSRKKCWYAITDIVPVIMAGIIGIYGLVVSVLISDGLKQKLPLFNGFIQLGAGLSVGLSGLAAGLAAPAPFHSLSKSTSDIY